MVIGVRRQAQGNCEFGQIPSAAHAGVVRAASRAGRAARAARAALLALALAWVFALAPLATTATPVYAAGGDAASSASADSASASSSAADSSLKTVHIGFPSSGKNWYNSILGEAMASGYLDEYLKPLGYKADATGFTGAAPALHEALAAGDLDLVDYAGFAGILGKSKGIDTTLISFTTYNSGWRLIASTKSGITSLKDLKGKKIAYTRGATPQMYLVKLLKEQGLTFSDITPVNATLQDGLSSVSTGAVDAAVVSAGQEQPLVNESLVKVLHKGAEADQATYYEPMVLIARTQFAKDNPKVIVAVLKAYLKAQAKMLKDPEAFYRLSAKEGGLPLEVIKASASKNPADNWPLSLSKNLVTSLKKVQDFELDNKITQAKVDIDAWMDPSYLRQALTEYGTDGAGTGGAKLAAQLTDGAPSSADAAAAASAQAGGLTLTTLVALVVVVAITVAIVAVRRQLRARLDDDARPVRVADAAFALILPLWIFFLWHVATASGVLSTVVLPTISTVASTLVEQLTTGTFKGDLAISISRILKGYALAAVLGVFFGVVMGMSLAANKFFTLTFQAFRQIPMMAWVPLLVIWFGIGEASKVAVIFLASFFPILVNTIDGIQRTDRHLVEVGRMYRLNPWRMFREIYLPSALPSIFVGLKLALGISWMAVVGAEMIAASSGIGFRINDDRVLMDYASVFAGMIAIAVAGVLMDAVLTVIARLCTPWRSIRQQ